MKHTEIPIKVTAWIDEGIAPLVIALNINKNVVTIASCESGTDGRAYVYFVAHSDPRTLYDVVAQIACALSASPDCHTLADSSSPVKLTIEWLMRNDHPMATISCRPEVIYPIAEIVKKEFEKVNNETTI